MDEAGDQPIESQSGTITSREFKRKGAAQDADVEGQCACDVKADECEGPDWGC